ncbi:hypothetical protein T458_26000 [Brevibacillus panacihumi W25]|uniref:Uncharacterized protein n=1 Tax=Brevibacillus panacihumi W25 TaxID=1408254 RepID=V6M1H3_9BACL|nr:hypothetical protein [Brevibacillus panacihumi]EST52192.1 hypothetical protein T458_26000 [Brevibacillus panacihumi W25]HZG81332.1 hypothetical protein [Brevibacillus sp.]
MKPYDANLRQLEIWKKTIGYEIKMMAPQSKDACDDFVMRLLRFEKQLQAEAAGKTEKI